MTQRPKTILVVEDHPECVEAISDALEVEGYRAIKTYNGLEALQFLENESAELPALILLDLMMPVMDGREFLEQQKRRPRLATLPVVLFSGERDLHKRAAELGVVGYLRKPVDLETLISTVAQHTSGPTGRAEASSTNP